MCQKCVDSYHAEEELGFIASYVECDDKKEAPSPPSQLRRYGCTNCQLLMELAAEEVVEPSETPPAEAGRTITLRELLGGAF